MTRIRIAAVAAVIGVAAITAAVPAAAAGPGEWDFVATKPFLNGVSGYDYTDYVHSSGGDFRACVSQSGYYRLREADTGEDDYVGGTLLWHRDAGECLVYESIGSFLDGSNNKAEFYLERSTIGSGSATYWD